MPSRWFGPRRRQAKPASILRQVQRGEKKDEKFSNNPFPESSERPPEKSSLVARELTNRD
jgi:hypothetical protein